MSNNGLDFFVKLSSFRCFLLKMKNKFLFESFKGRKIFPIRFSLKMKNNSLFECFKGRELFPIRSSFRRMQKTFRLLLSS